VCELSSFLVYFVCIKIITVKLWGPWVQRPCRRCAICSMVNAALGNDDDANSTVMFIARVHSMNADWVSHKPSNQADLPCESADKGCCCYYCPHPPSLFIIMHQHESWVEGWVDVDNEVRVHSALSLYGTETVQVTPLRSTLASSP